MLWAVKAVAVEKNFTTSYQINISLIYSWILNRNVQISFLYIQIGESERLLSSYKIITQKCNHVKDTYSFFTALNGKDQSPNYSCDAMIKVLD